MSARQFAKDAINTRHVYSMPAQDHEAQISDSSPVYILPSCEADILFVVLIMRLLDIFSSIHSRFGTKLNVKCI